MIIMFLKTGEREDIENCWLRADVNCESLPTLPDVLVALEVSVALQRGDSTSVTKHQCGDNISVAIQNKPNLLTLRLVCLPRNQYSVLPFSAQLFCYKSLL